MTAEHTIISYALHPDTLQWCERLGKKRSASVGDANSRKPDPFGGAGTTALVCKQLDRDCTMIELNSDYAPIITERIA